MYTGNETTVMQAHHCNVITIIRFTTHTFTWKQCTHMDFVCSSAHCYMSQHRSQSQLTLFIIEYLRNKLKLK